MRENDVHHKGTKGVDYRRTLRRRDPSETRKSERIMTMVYGFHVDSV